MSTFNSTDLIAVSRGGQTYKAEFGDVNATIVTNAAALLGSGMRNTLINGNFRLSRIGNNSITSGPGLIKNSYPKWSAFMDGSGSSRTLSRIVNTPGVNFNGIDPSRFLRFQLANGGSGASANTLEQKIESVRTLSGVQATISFFARSTSAMTIPFIDFIQFFGTGGSPSSNVGTVIAAPINVTTSWTYYVYTATIPSISGKTIGTNNDDYVVVRFNLPITPFTLEIAQVQLEPGPIATPFETRMVGQDQLLAERYFQDGMVYLGAYAGGAGSIRLGQVFFRTSMRAAPSVSIVSQSGTNYSGLTVSNINSEGFAVTATAGGAGPVNVDFEYTADMEY